MTVGGVVFGFGALIALLVLICAVILLVTDEGTLTWALGLIGALAVARIVP